MSDTMMAFDINGTGAMVLNWLGDALLFGSLLAGVTWLLIRFLGRPFPPAVEVFLWSIVLVKFLVPIGPALSFSPFGLNERPPVVSASHLGDRASFDLYPVHAVDYQERSASIRDDGQYSWHWSTAIAACYLACAAGLIIKRAWRHHWFFTRCRALPSADGQTQKIAEDVCRRLGVRRVPSVRMGGDTPSSFVTGFLRPILVIAHHHLVRPDELETVILHEVAHLRRGDMLVRYLQWIAGSILFFWPVVAWVNRRIDLVREYACDEWALRQGKLAAGEYARCLLHIMQSMHTARLACRPTGLASNRKSMERRIDMILQFPNRSSKRKRWNLFTWALLLLWGGFAVTGSAVEHEGNWPATAAAVKEHAVQVYNLVAAVGEADFNGDGVLTYVEKDTYLVALAMLMPKAFMEEFPYADRNQSGRLDYLEVYGVIRGITLIAYADRRPGAAGETRLDCEFYHMALEAQEWLLDNVTVKPGYGDLDNIWSIVKRLEGPARQDHHRKLDHGGPEVVKKSCKDSRPKTSRFQELESNIRTIKDRLAVERDSREAAKLQVMLKKLEKILSKLEY